jgi:hypothetical protein
MAAIGDDLQPGVVYQARRPLADCHWQERIVGSMEDQRGYRERWEPVNITGPQPVPADFAVLPIPERRCCARLAAASLRGRSKSTSPARVDEAWRAG